MSLETFCKRSTECDDELAWYIASWDKDGGDRTVQPPVNYENVWFVSKVWFGAREMARCFFGRDVPNRAEWKQMRGNPREQKLYTLVKPLGDGIGVQVLDLRTPSKPPDFNLQEDDPPSTNGKSEHPLSAEACEDLL